MTAYERLSVADRIFLEMEDVDVHMHVMGCFLFEPGPLTGTGGGVDVERVCDFVQARLFRIPRYRQRVDYVPIEGDPIWVDDPSFNIQYHVRHTRLPHPGEERQLKRLCGRIASQQLDRGKPLWEMWVVEGLEHDRFAVIAKVHHCMADGIGGVDLLSTLLSPTPVKTFEAGPVWLPRPAPERRRLLRDAARRRLTLPAALGGGLMRAARAPQESLRRARETTRGLREARALESQPASETPLNRPIGPHRRFDWLGFDLDAVKQVKKRFGGTVNDVALATATGALGRFLELRGITQREQQALDFRAACPVNTRRESERGRLGNRVSNLIARLPIAERDPVERLRQVSRTMSDLKASSQVLVFEALAALGEWTAPGLLTSFARGTLERRSSNFVFTNVPGPQTRFHLLDAPLTETYPMVPLMPGQSLGIALMSYSGGLYWGFNSDWEQLPDLHELVIATDACFHELCEAADAGR